MVEEVGLALADEFVVVGVGVGVGDEEQPASAAKPAAEVRPIAMAARRLMPRRLLNTKFSRIC